MKTILTAIIFLFVCSGICAQGQRATRDVAHNYIYKKGYEIKEVASADSALIAKIDVSKYEHLRKSMERVEVYDTENKVTIILYSTEEVCRIYPDDDPQVPSLSIPKK